MTKIDLTKSAELYHRERIRRGPQQVLSDIPEQLTRDGRQALDEDYGHDDTQAAVHTDDAVIGKSGVQSLVRDGSPSQLPALPEDDPVTGPRIRDGVDIWAMDAHDESWVTTPSGQDGIELFMGQMWLRGEEREYTYHRYEDRSPEMRLYLKAKREQANLEAARKLEGWEHHKELELLRKIAWFSDVKRAGKLVNLTGERLRKYILDSTQAAHPNWMP